MKKRIINIDCKKFIASMLISFIAIFGVMGFVIVDLSSIDGVIEASSSTDDRVVKDETQLTQIEKVANDYLSVRQKLWIADNPIIRVGRQAFYIAALFADSDEDFTEIYKEIDSQQSLKVKIG